MNKFLSSLIQAKRFMTRKMSPGVSNVFFFVYALGGLLNLWKRHWCILRDETLMWFRGRLVSAVRHFFFVRTVATLRTESFRCGLEDDR